MFDINRQHSLPSRTWQSGRIGQTLMYVLLLTVFSGAVLAYQLAAGYALPDASIVSFGTFGPRALSISDHQHPTTSLDRLSLSISGAVDAGTDALLSLALTGTARPDQMLAQAPYAFDNLEQGHYTLSAAWADGTTARTDLQLHKSQDLSEAQLVSTPQGYLLQTPANAALCALDVAHDKGRMTLRLAASQTMPEEAWQQWEKRTPVNIFSQRPGNLGVTTDWEKDRHGISPGARGTFVFTVKNIDPFPAEHYVRFEEDSSDALTLPLRYRIRHDVSGDDYIQGEQWQKAEDLLIPASWILPGEVRYYTLEWMWDATDDARDTAIGLHWGESIYRLYIHVVKTIPQPDGLHG